MAKQSLGIIGVGAFGAFMAKHLAPYFNLTLFDAKRNLKVIAKTHKARVGTLEDAASCRIVVVAVPVQQIEAALKQIAGYVKPGALVIDVASVKIKPTMQMKKILPKYVDVIGTHPLFGPQTGKNGIKGLNIALTNVRGHRAPCVAKFLAQKLKLNVHLTTAKEHDKELAYVQGLTHLLMKVVVALDLPKFRFTTKTYEYLEQMVEMIRYDSEELFRAIERENPYSKKAKKEFFSAARKLEEKLMWN
ncbi:MAG: prephenate dehydrogenase [Alphaproteobacteria bacterium]